MHIANAPCSWGILEFESASLAPSASQVLDEIAATGYAGTELGDWNFLPTDPQRLAGELEARQLALVGAFVDVALTDPVAHEAGEETAVRTARLLVRSVRLQADSRSPAKAGHYVHLKSAVTPDPTYEKKGSREAEKAPVVVLSDATARNLERTARAGRITANDSLTPPQFDVVAAGAERIARAVRDATGLRTVFHHHCATFVETPAEIDALMQRTSAELVGLCLDTGHATFGGGDPVALVDRYRDRIRHVHFKDCSRTVADRARAAAWDYVTAVRHGLFCELGEGEVDFAAVRDRLRACGYDGWIVVEQDVLPSMGTPAESAARNRRFLTALGL
jgi:inosose dehydratase